MIYLDLITRKLQVVMSAAAATTNPKVVVCKTQTTLDGTETKGATQVATLSGTTDVDVCDAPTIEGFVVNVKSIHIENIDTAAVTVRVKLDDSGTDSRLKSQQLAVGESLMWNALTGWQVF